MNPTQLERIAAPVIVNSMEKPAYDNGVSCLNNNGIQRLHHAVAETNRDVKEAEAEIRSDVRGAEAEIRSNIKGSEADIRRDIAKSEADIRYENAKSESDIRRDTVKVESDLKEFLAVQRNAADAQFLALNNRLCESEKTTLDVKMEVIKQGYEAKLSAKDAIIDSASRFQHLSERLTDKLNHGFEEVTEKLEECCCDNKLLAVQNTGLLNQLVKSLIK